MTSLVAVVSKHAIVMGTDSLGTTIKHLIDPVRLDRFFGDDNQLLTDDAGQPLLKDYGILIEESEPVPYDQLPHSKKLFRLGKRPIGVMFTGITAIGDQTVRNLVAGFADSEGNGPPMESLSTVDDTAGKLLDLLRERYEEAFPETSFYQPDLELIVAGYQSRQSQPDIIRIDVRKNEREHPLPSGHGIVFGGQIDWIQRIVFGTDVDNKIRLARRSIFLLNKYHQRLVAHVKAEHGIDDLPPPDSEDLLLFNEWDLDGIEARWDEFSEQDSIDCVDFFLRIMIGAQSVSSRLPTVGGDVHIAVIRDDGFFPVTKEVWKHGEHEVPIPEVGR